MRRAAVLLAALALAALAVWRLGAPPPPSDAERIRALFADAARAAEERRVGDAVADVSERFRGADGLDRRGVKQLVAAHVLRGEWVRVEIAGARVAVDGDRARANVDAVLARGTGRGKSLTDLLPSEASAHRFACALEREDGRWKVVSATWHPIALADALEGPPEPDATR